MSGDTYTYTRDDGSQMKLRVAGHKLLIRQCRTDESRWVVGDAKVASSLADAMVETFSKETPGALYYILAMGPDVGKVRPKKWFEQYRCKEVAVNGIWTGAVGDFVVIPQIMHMNGLWFRNVAPQGHPMREFDFLCDSCIVQAVIPDKQTG
jgi:hypothetical protein